MTFETEGGSSRTGKMVGLDLVVEAGLQASGADHPVRETGFGDEFCQE